MEVGKIEFGPAGDPLSKRLASDDGRTHWEGCETAHGHSACAARAIEKLKAALQAQSDRHLADLAELRQKFDELCQARDAEAKSWAVEREALRAELALLKH